jgi:hypothetical protein
MKKGNVRAQFFTSDINSPVDEVALHLRFYLPPPRKRP